MDLIYFKKKGFLTTFMAFGPLLLAHKIKPPCLCALQSCKCGMSSFENNCSSVSVWNQEHCLGTTETFGAAKAQRFRAPKDPL